MQCLTWYTVLNIFMSGVTKILKQGHIRFL